jgi:hypothetical protein
MNFIVFHVGFEIGCVMVLEFNRLIRLVLGVRVRNDFRLVSFFFFVDAVDFKRTTCKKQISEACVCVCIKCLAEAKIKYKNGKKVVSI